MKSFKIIKNKGTIEKKSLSKIIDMIPNIKKHQIKNSQILTDGLIPVISQEKEIISGYYNNLEPIYASTESPIIVFGDHSCTLKLIDFNFILGGDGTKVFRAKNGLDTLFLYYCIKNIGLHTEGYKRHFSILKEKEIFDIPNKKNICNILNKQESIILNIEKLISKTEKIFDYFELNLLSGKISLDDNKSNSWEKIKIKDSMNILYGKRITKKESSGLIPVYGGGNASFYTDSYSYENKWVIGRFALSKKCVRFISDKFWLLDSGFTFTSINNDEDFLGFKINSMQDYIYNVLARGAAQKNLDMKEFENLEIVIPPYEEQQKISKFLRKIVNLLDYQNQLLQKEKQKFEWLSEKLLSGEYLVVEDKE